MVVGIFGEVDFSDRTVYHVLEGGLGELHPEVGESVPAKNLGASPALFSPTQVSYLVSVYGELEHGDRVRMTDMAHLYGVQEFFLANGVLGKGLEKVRATVRETAFE